MDVTVILFDSDSLPDVDDEIDRWEGTINYEPSETSTPTTTTTTTTTTTITTAMTTTATPSDADEDLNEEQVNQSENLRLAVSQAVRGNDTVTFNFTAENVGDTERNGLTLQLTNIPDDWTVKNQSSLDGSWAPEDKTWFWRTLDGEATTNATVTFSVGKEMDSKLQT